MKSAFVVACFAAANSANANIIDSAKEFFANLPVTREDAMKLNRQSGAIVTPIHREVTLAQQHQALEAHHSLRAQRQRLGLSRMGVGAGQDLE